MADFSCSCGKTQREGAHPKDCERCADCGSKITAPGEENELPLEHVVVPRTEEGKTFNQCKRCGLII